MNEVFLMGKVITEVKFDFVLKSKRIKSIVKFQIKTINGETINIAGYNELADYIYRKIKCGNNVLINGYLAKNEVVVKSCQRA